MSKVCDFFLPSMYSSVVTVRGAYFPHSAERKIQSNSSWKYTDETYFCPLLNREREKRMRFFPRIPRRRESNNNLLSLMNTDNMAIRP